MTDISGYQPPIPTNPTSPIPVDSLTGQGDLGPNAAGLSTTAKMAPTTSFDPSLSGLDPTAPSVAPPSPTSDVLGGTAPVTLGANDLAERSSQLVKLYPSLKNEPAVIASLAGLPIADDDLFGSVGQTITASQAQTQAAVLSELDAPARWKRWQSFSKEAQGAILQTGMPAPTQPQPQHKGFWDQLGSDVMADVASPLLHGDIGKAAEGAVGAPFRVLGQAAGLARTATDNAGGLVNRDIVQPLHLGGAIKPFAEAGSGILNFPSHAYRFLDMGQKGGAIDPNDPTLGNTQGTGKLGLSYIERAWKDSAPGSPLYRAGDYKKVSDMLGGDPEKLALAEAVASTGDVTTGVQKVMGPPPLGGSGTDPAYAQKAQSLFQAAQTDPNFAGAVRQLQMAGVSYGRDGARDIGLKEGTSPYQLTSGALDAVYQWYANPLNAVGRVNSVLKASRAVTPENLAGALKAARFGDGAAVTAGDTTSKGYFANLAKLPLGPSVAPLVKGVLAPATSDARAVADTVARQRWLVAAADHINQHNVAGFIQARPQEANGISALNEYVNSFLRPARGVDTQVTPNDVLDWLGQGAGKTAVAQGKFSSYLTPNDFELPRLSKIGAASVFAKVASTPLGTLAEHPQVAMAPVDVAPTQAVLAKAGNLLGTLANAPYKTSELLRSGIHEGRVDLVGDNAVPSFSRYVRQYLLPSDTRDTLVNTFADATTTDARRDIVRQAGEAGMRAYGLDATDAGRTAMGNLLSGMRENYDPNGLDVLPDGSHRATLAPDLQEANAVDAPTLQELAKAGREANVLSPIRGGLTNPVFETMMHKYWAPFALLRLGFVPRIVSEEFLTALMRLQPGQIAEGYAASWLPRITRRLEAYSGLEADNPTSKLGAILASRAAGVTNALAVAHFGPDFAQTAKALDQARVAQREKNDAYRTIAKLADKQSKAANQFGKGSAEAAQAKLDVAALAQQMRESGDRAARSPIIRHAYGTMFGTGGGYLHSMGTSGDLLSIDGQYQPLKVMQMRGHFETVQRGTDPAFRTAAAEYLGTFGRSGVLRAGLDAVRGFGGDARTTTALRGAFKGTSMEKDAHDTQLLTNLRQAFNAAPQEVQDGLRYYQRAVAAGTPGALHDAGSTLRDMHINSDPNWADHTLDLAPNVRELIDRTIGRRNYQPVVRSGAEHEMAGTFRSTRNRTTKNRAALLVGRDNPDLVAHVPAEHGAPLDGQAIASMFAPPTAKVLHSKADAAQEAAQQMAAYMHSPAFADHIPSSDWLQHDLAQPVPEHHTRIYYPAATPDWRPGDLNLEGIDDPKLRADVAATVLNRKRISTVIDAATENPTHQAIGLWGHTNPFLAERVALHLAGDKAATGYVDVPNELRDALRYENPTVEHVRPESPWLADAKDAKQVTEQTAARMGNLGGALRGYRVPEELQARGHVLRDGHEVLDDGTWANGVSLEHNIQALAQRNGQRIADAFVANGRFLHGPVDDLLRQEPDKLRFNANHLSGVADGDLPEAVTAPEEMQLSGPTRWDRVVTQGFSKFVSPALESMVRSEVFAINHIKGLQAARYVEPHLVDQELRALGESVAAKVGVHPSDLRSALDLAHETEARGVDIAAEHPQQANLLEQAAQHDPDGRLADWGHMEDRVDDHMNQIAAERATRDSVPFINNHHARSNVTEYMRNVSPFLWAQESFLRRWSRALKYNPATFERLELGLHGLGSVGIVHKDQSTGQNVITIPGSGALTHLLGSVGLPYQMAASVPFTMEVKNLTPGFANPGVPSAGPILTVPLAALMGSQPEAATLGQDMGIPQPKSSPTTAAFEQLVPAGWARNLFGALTGSKDSQQWASARLEAMQMLAASGHAPSPGADAATMQTWSNQVANWTRNVYILRGALGFLTPATPAFDASTVKTLDGTVGSLHADLSADIKMFGVNEGVLRYMTDHPDGGAYTVFATSSAGGESAPATAPAEQMLAANPGFFQAHPYAGAYFLPPAPGNFDRNAYSMQLADGIRVKKGWDTLSREIVNSAASETYWQMHDQYVQALGQTAGDSPRQSQIKQAWTQWSQQFQQANPLFADQLNSSTAAATRGNVLDDLRNALATGNTPDPQAAGQLQGLLSLYDQWTQAHQVLSADHTAATTDRRRNIDALFAQMAASYVLANPLASQLYSRTIVPEIAAQDQKLGRALEATPQ